MPQACLGARSKKGLNMNAFMWQTVLLLSFAFFVGAALACLIRRITFVDRVPMRSGAAAADPAPASAPEMEYVELPAHTVPAQASLEIQPVRAQVPPPAEQPPRERGQADIAAAGDNVARFERALAGQEERSEQPAPTAMSNRDPAVDAATTAAVAAAAAAAVVAADRAEPSPVDGGATPLPGDDDLLRIRGMDREVVERLDGLGVHRFAQIAGWSAGEVGRINDALGVRRRVEQQNWIEQANILSQGRETAYSERRARGEVEAMATPVEISPPSARVAVRTQAPARPPQAEPLAQPAVSASDASAAARVGVAAASAPKAGTGTPDVARRAAFARRSSPAASTEPPASPLRVEASGAQATPKASAADEPSVQPARPARLFEAIRQNQSRDGALGAGRGDISGLRSVRSQGLRQSAAGAADGDRRGSGGQVLRSATPDDLKRIRGVGVLIEKRLNALGVTSYEQIANWTRADVLRISQQLDFKGRVERENWIEQGRILAAGGQTEFSRRVDRGEVEAPPRDKGNDD